MKKIVLFLIISIASLPGFSQEESHFDDIIPFAIGEKFVISMAVFGINIGTLNYTLSGFLDFQGKKVLDIQEWLISSEDIKGMYWMKNFEQTYLDLTTFSPVWFVKNVDDKEGKDRIVYNFNQNSTAGSVEFYSEVKGGTKASCTYGSYIRSPAALIYYARSLDYSYYLSRGKNIEVGYFDTAVVRKINLKMTLIKVNWKGKDENAIFFQEIGGDNMNFTLLLDKFRTPYQMNIPAFKVPIIGTISIFGQLKAFEPGTGAAVTQIQ
jgi:hypothetical protein